MLQRWKPAYGALTGYIESNPSIKIEPAVTVIPPDVRTCFYTAFDEAREAFIREYYYQELAAAEILSREYTLAAGDLTSLLDIQPEIQLNARLKWLMDDPLNGLMRLIYTPLFNLLKGKLDEEEFFKTCHLEFNSVFQDLYGKGYNLWVILALAQLLEPSGLMWVSQKEPNAINSLKELYKQGARIEPVPDITVTSLLTFEPGTWDTFIVPDFIFYSAKLDKYVAIRRSLPVNTDEPYLVAKQKTAEREWLSFGQLSRVFNLTNHWPDILIYCDEKLQNLNLIADYQHMLRPELAIDTFTRNSSFSSEQVERVRSHQQYLKPFNGTIVVYQEDIPDEAIRAFSPDEPVNTLSPEAGSAFSSSQEENHGTQTTGEAPAITVPAIASMTSRGFDRQLLNQVVSHLI